MPSSSPYPAARRSNSNNNKNTSTTTTTTTPATATAPPLNLQAFLADPQNQELLKMIGGFLLSSLIARLVFSALTMFYVVAFPFLYIYALQTCPTESSFEAKKELKRVFRGQHLPESHPDKPKGFWERNVARMTAAVTAELATLPGYTVSMLSLAGAAMVVTMQIPSSNLECVWLGAFGKWYYIFSRSLEPNNKQD